MMIYMLNAELYMNVVLLPLNICLIMHLSMFYVFKHFSFSIICMHMFMGLDAQMFDVR